MLKAMTGVMKTVGETAKAYPMEYVEDGHVFENIMMGDEVDLKKFPVTKWHPEDGGHYIGTADLNIYKDPDTGWVNVGTYRSMVHDKNTVTAYVVGVHHGSPIMKKYWAKGEPCPVVLVVGSHPIMFAFAATDCPAGVNEY